MPRAGSCSGAAAVVDRVLTVPDRIGCQAMIAGRDKPFNPATRPFFPFQPSWGMV